MNYEQLTTAHEPTHKVRSGHAPVVNGKYGEIAWSEWCEKEAARIRGCGGGGKSRDAVVRTFADGTRAVFVNKIINSERG